MMSGDYLINRQCVCLGYSFRTKGFGHADISCKTAALKLILGLTEI
jgi:hypothetical protein